MNCKFVWVRNILWKIKVLGFYEDRVFFLGEKLLINKFFVFFNFRDGDLVIIVILAFFNIV